MLIHSPTAHSSAETFLWSVQYSPNDLLQVLTIEMRTMKKYTSWIWATRATSTWYGTEFVMLGVFQKHKTKERERWMRNIGIRAWNIRLRRNAAKQKRLKGKQMLRCCRFHCHCSLSLQLSACICWFLLICSRYYSRHLYKRA